MDHKKFEAIEIPKNIEYWLVTYRIPIIGGIAYLYERGSKIIKRGKYIKLEGWNWFNRIHCRFVISIKKVL